jgi:hypothetical protein
VFLNPRRHQIESRIILDKSEKSSCSSSQPPGFNPLYTGSKVRFVTDYLSVETPYDGSLHNNTNSLEKLERG